jgi:L-fucose isomerase-like protein
MLSREVKTVATTVRTVYLSKETGRQGWPSKDFDPGKRAAELERQLVWLKGRLDFELEFTGAHVVTSAGDVSRLKEAVSGEDDGLLLFILASGSQPHLNEIMQIDMPKVSFIDLFGYFVLPVPEDVIGISSSDFTEIGRALKAVDTVRRVKQSKVLCVSDRKDISPYQTEAQDRFGIEIELLGHEPLLSAYEQADEGEARDIASEYIDNAQKVVEPTTQEIAAAARMYLGTRQLMKDVGANVITVDCLPLTYAGLLPAFPCLAFSRLNDEGLTGVCEADLAATLTQMLVGFLADRPGFVSDPVIDTSEDTIIHSHCVAATKMGGVDSYPEPYVIRSHAEDDESVSLQVKMSPGRDVTHAKLADFETMLVARGTTAGSVDIDKGCRTKVRMRVSNARKLYQNYRGGLHRVMFYGDLVRQIEDLGKLLGFTVVDEC